MSVDTTSISDSTRGQNAKQQEEKIYKMPSWDCKEDIVISGISGRFPESSNIEELKKNLFDGVDMVTENDRRWKPGLFETPKRMGKLKEIDKFDMMFFGIPGKIAETMDPQQRLMLEVTYEAIFDSGYDPSEFIEDSVGVYMGCCERSSGKEKLTNDTKGYSLMGMNNAFLANRISFTFGFTGPSMVVDTACSSSMTALNQAYIALRSNLCDAAIVGGAQITLTVSDTIAFTKLGVLSIDGKCKSFDNSADGFVRSEAVIAIFLQKASRARRNYATVLHCKSKSDGVKPEGISFPSRSQQVQLFREVFGELEMNTIEVDYVEVHGTGTIVGDREEGNAIAEFFCKGRTAPLSVGTVKSNMGHTEAASGICAIAKIVLSFEEEIIPPNLHYRDANSQVPALVEGKIKIIEENTSWKPGVVAVNNWGLGGSKVHLVLRANQKEQPSKKQRHIPRLVLANGRTEEAIKYIFDKVRDDQYTDEAIVLLEEACKGSTNGMSFRGYGLVQTPGEEIEAFVEKSPTDHQQVWFLFSGMGSQWPGMIKDMMKIDIFAKSIRMSAQVLIPYGVDLIHLLTDATEDELNQVVSPFVTIAAVQIALMDMLRALGIEPNGIVGHSLGEQGCAYADGCLTAEQMIMVAFWKGNSCAKTELTKGAMAAVGMTWEEAKKRCPEGVFPVCHNTEDSVTISGPAEAIDQFVEELYADNIFVRKIKTCDIAFHCKYLEPAVDLLRNKFRKLIPNPLPRSSRWVSSSVVEENWNSFDTQLSSADYHVNNFISPVLFKEAMDKIPKSALVIEVAPHSLLKSIVKRNLGPQCIYVGLMERGHPNNLVHCLGAIGKMYTSNLNPKVKNLYEPVSFPVPRGTPMLNSLVQWDHSVQLDNWNYAYFTRQRDRFTVDTFQGTEGEYLLDHKVDGMVLFPFMGYVWLAWKALALSLLVNMDELPVLLENINVFRVVLLPESGKYVFDVKVLDYDGNFRILEGESIVASGVIRKSTDVDSHHKLHEKDLKYFQKSEEMSGQSFTLNAADFYKEVRVRGYELGSNFQGVLSVNNVANTSGLNGRIKWDGHWVSFMDAMLQIPIILCDTVRSLQFPTRIKSIRIDPKQKPEPSKEGVPFTFNPFINVCRAGPVDIEGFSKEIVPRRKTHSMSPILEQQIFVPLYDSCVLTKQEVAEVEEYSHICLTLVHQILKVSKKNNTEISEVMSGFKGASSELIEKYAKTNDRKHVMLKMIKAVLNIQNLDGLQQKVKSIIMEYTTKIQNDLLATTLLREKSLRSALEIVQENTFSTKMKVLEVSVNSVIHKAVMHMLKLTPLNFAKFDFTLVRINEDPLPEGLLDSRVNLLVSEIKDIRLPGENDLVVAKDLFTDSNLPHDETLSALTASILPKGFLLLLERTGISPAEKLFSVMTQMEKQVQKKNILEEAFRQAGLRVISKKEDQINSVLYLLRKIPETKIARPEPRILHIYEDNGYTWVEDLKKLLKECDVKPDNPAIWLIAENPTSGIVGLFNSLKQEPGGKNLRFFFSAADRNEMSVPKFGLSNSFFSDMVQNDLAVNVLKQGQWGQFRHHLLETDPNPVFCEYSFVNITKPGDMSSFKWIQSCKSNMHSLRENEHVEGSLIRVYYAALNFKDLMLASGKLPPDEFSSNKTAQQESLLGIEFVGRDPNGRRVMGLTTHNALASYVVSPDSCLIPVPDHWTMEEASTVPAVYMTSYYALIVRGQMRKGQTVLIHSGAGGVGHAAISICLSMGCRVFVTVGSKEKKTFLLETFPELKSEEVFHSRDVRFQFQLLNATQGKGVDLVLNSLADEIFQASLKCLKTNGQFLEIGKYDIAMNRNLGLGIFDKNITFHAISMGIVLMERKIVLQEIIHLLQDGIRSGVVKPLKVNLFLRNQVEAAFRFMASGKHVGKVVIKIRDEDDPNSRPVPMEIPSVPRTYFSPEKSYIITGGLGGVGLELAGWLVNRGAKKVVLASKSGVKNEYQRFWINRWRTNDGAQVLVSIQNIGNHSEVQALLQESINMGPVGGIFHLAMVLHDGLFENLTAADFEEVALAKVRGTRQLDQQSRYLCPELDHFVVFSSVSCGRGNPGQSNYSYANSVMERVVERRKDQGLPGLAIQWGNIGEVESVYQTNDQILKKTTPQQINSCLEVMDRFMQEDFAVVSCFVPVVMETLKTVSRNDIKGLILRVLGIKDPSTIMPKMTMGELGMDSLMGVEIKQVLETEYKTVLTLPEIRQLSFKQLEEIGREKTEDQPKKNIRGHTVKGIKIVSEFYIPSNVAVLLNKKEGTPNVFFLHPLEGHTNILKGLASNIKAPVYGIQFTDDVPCDSIEDMASCYIEHLKQIQPHGPYHLVGYSYGATVAFEIALQLQKTDHVQSYVCLDASPATLIETAQNLIRKNEKKELCFNPEPLMKLITLYLDHVPEMIENSIRNISIGDIDLARKLLLPYLMEEDIDKELVIRYFERMFRLLRNAQRYQPSGVFRGKATLVRVFKEESIYAQRTHKIEDYDLGKHVDGSVEVFKFIGNHISIAYDVSGVVSKIINDRL